MKTVLTINRILVVALLLCLPSISRAQTQMIIGRGVPIWNSTTSRLTFELSVDGISDWVKYTVDTDKTVDVPALSFRISTTLKSGEQKVKAYKLTGKKRYKLGWNDTEACWDLFLNE